PANPARAEWRGETLFPTPSPFAAQGPRRSQRGGQVALRTQLRTPGAASTHPVPRSNDVRKVFHGPRRMRSRIYQAARGATKKRSAALPRRGQAKRDRGGRVCPKKGE
ncbi:uncharacterized protein Tco025E_10100, partial [Trypanosoma conorhini]